MPKKIYTKLIIFILALWIIFWFVFNKHFVEVGAYMESWFAYKGLIFYKDFSTFHFPLGRLPLMLIHYFTNGSTGSSSYVALFFGLLILYPLYLFGIKFLSKTATFISLAFFSLFYWITQSAISYTYETLISFFLAITLYLFFNLVDNVTLNPKKLLVFGLMVSLCELSGQLATITLATIVGLLIFRYLKRYNTKKLVTPLFYLLFGLAIPFTVTILYFIFNNALGDFISSNTLPYITYAESAQRTFWGLPFRELLAYYTPLLTLITLMIFRVVKKEKLTNSLYFFLIGISTIPFIFFGIYHPHHLLYALPVFSIMAGYVYDLAKSNINGRFIILVGAIIFVSIYLWNLLPRLTKNITFPPDFTVTNDTRPGDGMYESIEWMKENSQPSDKIIVVGNPLFYVKSNRMPASRPSENMPHKWEPFDKVKKELLATPPKYWVVFDSLTRRIVKDFKKPQMMEWLNNVLNSCYKSVYKNSGIEIWERVCS
ncbi:ArnT family glycosyltransferase [Patescibacteria group bacterium]